MQLGKEVYHAVLGKSAEKVYLKLVIVLSFPCPQKATPQRASKSKGAGGQAPADCAWRKNGAGELSFGTHRGSHPPPMERHHVAVGQKSELQNRTLQNGNMD